MVSVCIAAYQPLQILTGFAVRRFSSITETFLSLVVSEHICDMELLVKVCVLTPRCVRKVKGHNT